ncbi:MAG: hypothetical protein AAFV62_14075 [Pseudomonadota bacterium]
MASVLGMAVRRLTMGLRSGLMAATVAAAPVFGLATFAVPAPATAQDGAVLDSLEGQFYGVDAAEGFAIEIAKTLIEGAEVAGSFDVRFMTPGNGLSEFVAMGGNGVAQGQVDIGGTPVVMRFSSRPVGVVLFIIPVGETGEPEIDKTRSFGFLRQGISVPRAPDVVAAPPPRVVDNYEPLYFLSAYEFWTPQEVGLGYASLLPRWRTLLRLYSSVHTDVLWKLCRGRETPAGLTEALEGQNVTCETVLGKVSEMQRVGTFVAYKRDVAEERARLEEAVKCARDMLDKRQCVLVSKFTAKNAVSLDTAETILDRY